MSDVRTLNVVIEIPRGGSNKYEVDHKTGRIRLDRSLFTAMQYPADYGYIEGTLGLDGDPLDALVLTEYPVFPGCLIHARPVAMFNMTDEHGPDAKIICVPEDIRYDAIRDIDDIDEWKKAQIRQFFANYKSIEPGKHVDPNLSWEDLAAANKEINAAFARAGKH